MSKFHEKVFEGLEAGEAGVRAARPPRGLPRVISTDSLHLASGRLLLCRRDSSGVMSLRTSVSEEKWHRLRCTALNLI